MSGLSCSPPGYFRAHASSPTSSTTHDGSMKLTYELRGLGDDALASRLVPRHAFSPPDARQALAGQWLYMVGDSSLRGLWLSLYQQLAGDQMGDAMDVMHWLGPERDIMEMAWADAVVNATDGRLLGVRTLPWHSSIRKGDGPNPDGGLGYAADGDAAASLGSLWCFGASLSAPPMFADASHPYARHPPGIPRAHRVDIRVPNAPHLGPSAATAWCPAPRDRIRLTWRFLTYAHRITADPFLELRTVWSFSSAEPGASAGRAAGAPLVVPPPDVHILENGCWDERGLHRRDSYEEELLRGLANWRTFVPARTKLIYVTPPVALHLFPSRRRPASMGLSARPGLSACEQKVPTKAGWQTRYSGGVMEEALWAPEMTEAWTNVTAGVQLLNRVHSGVQLLAGLGPAPAGAGSGRAPNLKLPVNQTRCKCLDPAVRAALRDSLEYHPPHVHNVWDAQRLMMLVRRPWAQDVNTSHHNRRSRRVTLHFAQPLWHCCCMPPLPATKYQAVEKADHWRLYPLRAMWANTCYLRESSHTTFS